METFNTALFESERSLLAFAFVFFADCVASFCTV